MLSTVQDTQIYGGREHVLFSEGGIGALKGYADIGIASIQGADAWGKRGVAVSLMTELRCSLYLGEIFDNNTAAIWPRNVEGD